MSTVQLFRRERMNATRFDQINAAHRDANIDSIFYYAVFYPADRARRRARGVDHHLVRRPRRPRRRRSRSACWWRSCSTRRRFFRPISDMSEKFNVLQSAMASSERIFTLLDTPVEYRDARRVP